MSRRRERGLDATWLSALGVVHAPSLGPIAVLALLLLAIFVLWLATAQLIYSLTLGPEPPASLGAFLSDALANGPGWALVVIGIGVGFLFAVVVLTLSGVAFPIDRKGVVVGKRGSV